MKNTPSVRLAFRRTALVALGCALCATFLAMPVAQAAEMPIAQRLADKAPKLPMTPTFEKKGTGEGPQYVLHLKNDSKNPLKVSAVVLLSVVAHSMDKARKVPEQTVAAGGTLTIPELASMDKVTVKAEGFEPLHLVVP